MRPSEYSNRSDPEAIEEIRVLQDAPKDASNGAVLLDNLPSSSDPVTLSNASLLLSLSSTVSPSHPAALLIGESPKIPVLEKLVEEQVSSPSFTYSGTQDGIDQPPPNLTEYILPPTDLELAVSGRIAPLSATEAITTNDERLDLDVIVNKTPLSILPPNTDQEMLHDHVANPNSSDDSLSHPTTTHDINLPFTNGADSPSNKPFFLEWQPTKTSSSTDLSQKPIPTRPSSSSSFDLNSTFPSLMSLDGSTPSKTESSSPPSYATLSTFAVTSVGELDMRPLKKAKLTATSEISESKDMDIGPAVPDETAITQDLHAATSSAEFVIPAEASTSASPMIFTMDSLQLANNPPCNNKSPSPAARKVDPIPVIDLTIDEDCSPVAKLVNPGSPQTRRTPPAAILTPEPTIPAPASDIYPASPQDSDLHHFQEPESPTPNRNLRNSQTFVDYDPFYDTLRTPGSKPVASNSELIPSKQKSTVPTLLQDAVPLIKYYQAYEIITNKLTRKPYLSKRARNFLPHLGGLNALSRYEHEIIHIDFSPEEVDFVKAGSRPIFGRTEEDCQRFLMDYPTFQVDYNRPQIIQIDASRASRSLSDQISQPQSFLRQRYREEIGIVSCRSDRALCTLRNLKPCSTFNHASGDVIDFKFSPVNNNFAVCCNTLTNEYNRPGNLLFGDAKRDFVSTLNGHADRTVGAEKYYTVSDIRFSNDGEYLYSGSYDNTVKIWDVKGEMVGCLTDHGRITALSTTLCSDRVLAVAADDGNIYLYDVRNPGKQRRTTFKAQNDRLCGSFLVPGHGLYSHWMLAGFEAKDSSCSGALYAYDVIRGTMIHRIVPASNSQTAAYFHPSTNIFVVGATGHFFGAGPTARSVVRVFDPRSEKVSMEIAIDSTQKDINKVTVSPCGFCITSSGTDGNTFVWDLRTVRQSEEPQPLHVLSHGPTKMVSPVDGQLEDWDTGVMVAEWLPQSDYLMTGGSDGFLKLWDVRLGKPFLWDVGEFDSAVSTADFNCDRDMLGVGESSGRVTFLDWHGPAEAGELRKFQLNQGVVEQAGNEGIQAARELINSGMVVIHENGGFRSAVGV